MIQNRRSAGQIIAAMRAAARVAIDELRAEAVKDLKVMTGIQGPPRSQPGEAPHMDTTALNQSIDSQPYDENGGSTVGGVIGENAVYSLAIEFGFEPNNLAPRPHQSVEMNKVKDEGLNNIAKVLKREMRG